MTPKRVGALLATAVVLLVLWRYWDTLGHAALFGDDYMNISRGIDMPWQTHIKGFLAPNNSYNNRPLGNLVLVAFYRWFGPSPLPFLALMLGLHLATAFIGFFLASRLLQNKFLAFIAALAWSWNFATADNVVSLNLIFDNLLAFFWTASLLLYLQDREDGSKVKYIGSLLCFFLCTRSKEVGIMLPLALLAFEAASWNPQGLTVPKRYLTELVAVLRRQWPFYVIALLYLIFFLRKSEYGLNSEPTHPYYMKLTWDTFLDGMKFFLDRATLEHGLFQNTLVLYITAAGMCVWAVVIRQRILLWTLFVFVITLLPVVFFVNHRMPVYMYLPFFSLVLTAVGLLGHSMLLAARPFKTAGMLAAYAIMGLLAYQYVRMNQPGIGGILAASRAASMNGNEILTRLKQWYPDVPAHARFYFVGVPQGQPTPILLIGNMPRLLYRKETIRSTPVERIEDIMSQEAAQPDNDFYCFDFTGSNSENPVNFITNITPRLRALKDKERARD